MIIDKKINDIIKDRMKEKEITYAELAKEADISRTYLVDIVVKSKIPNYEIIKKIVTHLDFDPEEIREYRILRIQDYLHRFYLNFNGEDLDRIDEVIKSVKPRYRFKTRKTKIEKKMNTIKDGSDWIDLSGLQLKHRRFLMKMYKEIKDTLDNK